LSCWLYNLHVRGCEKVKTEKKEYLVHKQIYEQTVKRNKKIGMVNLLIFSIGLVLKYLGMPETGGHFIWLGIVILVYTFGSNMLAKHEMQKYQVK
jgi:hypothetical protein